MAQGPQGTGFKFLNTFKKFLGKGKTEKQARNIASQNPTITKKKKKAKKKS